MNCLWILLLLFCGRGNSRCCNNNDYYRADSRRGTCDCDNGCDNDCDNCDRSDDSRSRRSNDGCGCDGQDNYDRRDRDRDDCDRDSYGRRDRDRNDRDRDDYGRRDRDRNDRDSRDCDCDDSYATARSNSYNNDSVTVSRYPNISRTSENCGCEEEK